MTLYMIGLGLGDEKDISLKGLEIVRSCDYIYLESYTSKLDVSVKKLEALYGKKIMIADRSLVENDAEKTILKNALASKVAFLVIGDVFSATTHTDLKLRALELGIKVEVIHNASILTAIGVTGLELYKFGKVTSIPFLNDDVRTPLEVLEKNKSIGLHTLMLLDLHPLENKFMNVHSAFEYLLKFKNKLFNEETLVVVCCALGMEEQKIKFGKVKDLIKIKFDSYPQCLIVPGELHFMEEDSLKTFK
ncbi:diphthine synthase [Candidatus Woesearchaeota archaeon]|nr:diphthine synthase [Candidatus Woesearchaeota archaeon]